MPYGIQQLYQHTWGRVLSVILIALFILAGCNDQKETHQAETQDKKEILIGITVGNISDMIRDVIGPQLEQQGYRYKLVEFADYIRPNIALADGDLDINIFQHKPYLDAFKAQHNLPIEAVFQIPTPPYGLYAGKTARLEDAYPGMKVSAPNDSSNYARVLVILDHLGWIKLKENTNYLTASREDIAENLFNIEIITLDAGQLPRSLQDVDFSAINGNFAISAGLDPKDAVFTEPTFTFVNWSAARTEDRDAPWLKAVTDAFNSDAFKAYIAEHYEGYQLPEAWKN